MSTTATHKDPQATTALTVRLPAELADALKNYAFLTNTSGNEVLKKALIEYLKTHGRPEMMRAAFERVVEQHRIALDKMKDM
jgi:sugar (pentulose or hexulose) kinase